MPIQNVNTAVPAQAGEIAGASAVGAVLTNKAASTDSARAASAGVPQTAAKQPPSIAQLQRLINSMNKAVQQGSSNLEFTMDSGPEKILVKLIDTSTGDVIRQIPSEEMLAIAQSIEQMQQGLLLNKEA
ncbi:MAG: flagellar protein FlaG [Gallionella sp.]|nr:flagellar protein FlaG [Gallionella sp.]